MMNLLCAWCVDRNAIRMQFEDGKMRPVCDSCSGLEPVRVVTELSIVEQVERCVIAQPGVTSGAIRVSLRHSVKNVEAILQALRRCVKVGSVTRTGEKWKYQYWPAAKKEAA